MLHNPLTTEEVQELTSISLRASTAVQLLSDCDDTSLTIDDCGAIDDGIAALKALPKLIADVERFQWQPIETALKTDEILVTDGTAVAVGFWEDEIDDPDSGRSFPGDWIPLGDMGVITHWMPKPTPPLFIPGDSNES